MMTSEDERDKMYRTIGNLSPTNTPSHPRRLQSSATTLSEPHISHTALRSRNNSADFYVRQNDLKQVRNKEFWMQLVRSLSVMQNIPFAISCHYWDEFQCRLFINISELYVGPRAVSMLKYETQSSALPDRLNV
jgi:hypothetical protein